MRKKLIRFQDNAQRENLIEVGKPNYQLFKGQWATMHFKNNHPIIVELGCGEGDYTTRLAECNPHKNFIGVDIKGARLWVGSDYALKAGLANAAFLRTHIVFIDQFFAANEVAELYLTFPDPRPRDRDAKRRLTSPRFLDLYRKILQPGGKVHLKTDNDQLFAYTLSVVESQTDVSDLQYTTDLYQDSRFQEQKRIQTKYERRYLAQGIKIKYLCFQLG